MSCPRKNPCHDMRFALHGAQLVAQTTPTPSSPGSQSTKLVGYQFHWQVRKVKKPI